VAHEMRPKKRADFICPYGKFADQVGAHEMSPKKRADFICPYRKFADQVGAHGMRPKKNGRISSALTENSPTKKGT